MDSLEIIKKHLTPEVPFKLKNEDGSEDIIYLKPLNVGEQVLCYKVSRKMSEFNKNSTSPDEETMRGMFDLFSSIIRRSVPGIDNVILENFVLTNFTELSDALESLIPQSKNKEQLEVIKKRLEQRKKEEETK